MKWICRHTFLCLMMYCVGSASALAQEISGPELLGEVQQVPVDEVTQEEPFVPALDISNAIVIRLGSDLLNTLGNAVPTLVDPQALSGYIGDRTETRSSDGIPVEVTLQGISYSGQLGRVTIKAQSHGIVTITAGLRNINVNINSVHVKAKPSGILGLFAAFLGEQSATTGPMNIQIANRSDIGIAVDVKPYVADGKLKFQPVATRLKLNPDNMTVNDPAWISTQGMFMQREKVLRGLRDGFNNDPSQFEKQLANAVPRMISSLEDRFEFDDIDSIVADLWPLPSYAPRVRPWVSSASVDADGMILHLGLTQSAYDTSKPVTLKSVEASSVLPAPAGTSFQFGLDPSIVEHMTNLLVDAGLAHVNVEDMPMASIHPLGLIEVVQEIIPDLKAKGIEKIRSELDLRDSIKMTPNGGKVDLDLTNIVCIVSIPDGENWKPYAEFAIRIRQTAQPAIKSSPDAGQVLAFSWQGEPQIEVKATFVEGANPENMEIGSDDVKAMFVDGWKEWTEVGDLAEIPLDVIDLGFAKVRPETVNWNGSFLTTQFGPAGLKIRNLGKEAISYSVQAPSSAWSAQYSLAAGASHHFNVASPLKARFTQNGLLKTYTIAAGALYEFQSANAGPELYTSTSDW